MWPFEDRLKDQDAVEKYRRWLRRWLLEGDSKRERRPAPEGSWANGG